MLYVLFAFHLTVITEEMILHTFEGLHQNWFGWVARLH
jgi:hypothetical protein